MTKKDALVDCLNAITSRVAENIIDIIRYLAENDKDGYGSLLNYIVYGSVETGGLSSTRETYDGAGGRSLQRGRGPEGMAGGSDILGSRLFSK